MKSAIVGLVCVVAILLYGLTRSDGTPAAPPAAPPRFETQAPPSQPEITTATKPQEQKFIIPEPVLAQMKSVDEKKLGGFWELMRCGNQNDWYFYTYDGVTNEGLRAVFHVTIRQVPDVKNQIITSHPLTDYSHATYLNIKQSAYDYRRLSSN